MRTIKRVRTILYRARPPIAAAEQLFHSRPPASPVRLFLQNVFQDNSDEKRAPQNSTAIRRRRIIRKSSSKQYNVFPAAAHIIMYIGMYRTHTGIRG